MCRVMQEYEEKAAKKAIIESLSNLVKDGLLSKEEAAKRADVSVMEIEQYVEHGVAFQVNNPGPKGSRLQPN